MKINLSKSILYTIPLLLSGCASIVSGVNQPISVNTSPAQGAKCTLKNSKGTWYVSNTPGSVVVHRSGGNLNIRCEKPGYATANKSVPATLKGVTGGNILFGGLVGVGVDAADGAAFHYPESIVIPMSKQ